MEKSLTIINSKGLHARASGKLAELCQQFQSDITITYNDKHADGKNLLKLMMLAAACGSNIQISASGTDEAQAINAIEQLITQRFDEDR